MSTSTTHVLWTDQPTGDPPGSSASYGVQYSRIGTLSGAFLVQHCKGVASRWVADSEKILIYII